MSREDIGPLTRSERLLLDRRRRGENQRQAAARLDMPLSRYSMLERGVEEPIKAPNITKLQPHERCLLYRRRAGVEQHEVALDMGVCRRTIMLMETGRSNCDELLHYWEH
jgi:transcriptional regulator with XRE-family HTH domain